ncbi:hypothetical protein LCGC14_0338490 [marine sediment metagenome]|uniref:Uncharacterized protein n=1 Tax=marine sediment metagenome TaxID=412755 RepID=A0A0F9TEJ6_9ZZZZ
MVIEFEEHKVESVERSPIAIVCDRCNARFRHKDDIWEYLEILRVDFTGGYGSIFGDGCKFECDLCQECVKKILGPFLRKTQINEYI